MSTRASSFGPAEPSVFEKLLHLNWGLILLLLLTASVGFAMLFSAANGNVNPWASRQVVRLGVGLVAMVIVALIDLRFWLRMAYPAYLAGLALLGLVELGGQVGMGAQRWLDLGVSSRPRTRRRAPDPLRR